MRPEQLGSICAACHGVLTVGQNPGLAGRRVCNCPKRIEPSQARLRESVALARLAGVMGVRLDSRKENCVLLEELAAALPGALARVYSEAFTHGCMGGSYSNPYEPET